MKSTSLQLAAILLCLGGFGTPKAPAESGSALRHQDVRAKRVRMLAGKATSAKEAAWATARRHGWAPRVQNGPALSELMFISDGRVYVCQTANRNAGISTATDGVRGTAPYNATGSGMTVGVWDAGLAMATHQELVGRVFGMDSAGLHDHSTHVSGTIGAAGVDPAAIGMAPQARIDSYDWNSDLAEMTARAMAVSGEPGKIQVSNHSYAYAAGWDWSTSVRRWYGEWGQRESFYFSQYAELASDWDALCYEAPFYLPFVAAGNDRDDGAPAAGATFYYLLDDDWVSKTYDPLTDPYADNWDNGGFDTTSTLASGKNTLAVGAVLDAVAGGIRDLSQAGMATFSAWGPADDGRVKPDIVANGTVLYSCTAAGNAAYGNMSGTSMATANASGSAILLIDYYGRLFPGQCIRASTLKGLIIHTADDLDSPGPDYRTGWGLMNTRTAADQLRRHGRTPNAHRVVEGVLTSAEGAAGYAYQWDGAHPIRVTLCWTDPPALPLTDLDDPSPRLINDLDLRVTAPDGTTVHYPYVLDRLSPTQAAVTGDNVLDNIEQVHIPVPVDGSYTVQVSHKGTLSGDRQDYSLVVSGNLAVVIGDFDGDEDVDAADLTLWEACASGPGIIPAPGCENRDLDGDGDADHADFGVFQHCYTGAAGPLSTDCVR